MWNGDVSTIIRYDKIERKREKEREGERKSEKVEEKESTERGVRTGGGLLIDSEILQCGLHSVVGGRFPYELHHKAILYL